MLKNVGYPGNVCEKIPACFLEETDNRRNEKSAAYFFYLRKNKIN